MYTLPTGRIVNSLQIRTIARSKSRKDTDQPGLTISISVPERAQHEDAERTAEVEHRRSFS